MITIFGSEMLLASCFERITVHISALKQEGIVSQITRLWVSFRDIVTNKPHLWEYLLKSLSFGMIDRWCMPGK